MKSDRIEFYDPLYETIVLEPNLPERRMPRLKGPVDPREIVAAPEFVRLAYLRQAGLAWLLYPSASHTRFSHSVGTWWLANIAESRIKVTEEGRPNGYEKLREWLIRRGLREEFYLALLLHDIGHGPLSHVVEHNKEFTSALIDAGIPNPDHEHRGVALITEEGPISRRWREIARARYGEQGDSGYISSVLKRLADKDIVCLPAIYYSITGDEKYRDQCTSTHSQESDVQHNAHDLEVIKELVSGMLDLDRLDHAARDSYFSGLRQLVINVSGLLNNLRVVAPSAEGDEIEWFVGQDGATHAATLLFDRRLLFTTMFRNPNFLALTAMINRALTLHLLSIEDRSARASASLDLSLMEDDQFIDEMSKSADAGASALGKQVRCSKPWVLAGKWSATDIASDRSSIQDTLKDYEEKNMIGGIPTVILQPEKGLWGPSSVGQVREWLDAKSFLLEGTRTPLTEHPDFKDDFAHLFETSKLKYLWGFAKNEEMASQVRKDVDRLVGKGD